MNFTNKKILMISPEAWGENFISKHHYALELAKRGNKVFFLNPPSTIGEIQIAPIKEHPQVFQVDYNAPRGVNRLPSFLADVINSRTIAKLLRHLGGPIDLIWSFDPFRFQNLKLFKAKQGIYFAADIHQSNHEHRLINSADLCLTVSTQLAERLKGNKPVYSIGHGLSDSFFNNIEVGKPHISDRISVGYVGNLASSYLDKGTLLKIVHENKEVDFHFIGPYQSSNLSAYGAKQELIDSLKTAKNAILHGAVPSEEIASRLTTFDLMLLCYDADRYPQEVSNSHKLLEYLASGKPIVANYTAEYGQKPGLLLMSQENRQLPDLFKECLSKLSYYSNEEQTLQRVNFAKSRTYSQQLRRIEDLLKRHSTNHD